MARRASKVVTQPTETAQGGGWRQGKQHVVLLTDSSFSPSNCACGKHASESCRDLLRMDANGCWTEVKRLRLCFRCLKRGHPYFKCRSKKKCDKCDRIHHALIYNTEENANRTAPPPTSTSSNAAPTSANAAATSANNATASGTSAAAAFTRPVATAGPSTAPAHAPLMLSIPPSTTTEPRLLMRVIPVKLCGRGRRRRTRCSTRPQR